MLKLFFLAIICCFSLLTNAQDKTPPSSPSDASAPGPAGAVKKDAAAAPAPAPAAKPKPKPTKTIQGEAKPTYKPAPTVKVDLKGRYPNGQLKEKGDTVNGFKEGVWTLLDPKGKKTGTLNYVKGIKEGDYELLFENGAVKEKGKYNNDKPDGEIITYYVMNYLNMILINIYI